MLSVQKRRLSFDFLKDKILRMMRKVKTTDKLNGVAVIAYLDRLKYIIDRYLQEPEFGELVVNYILLIHDIQTKVADKSIFEHLIVESIPCLIIAICDKKANYSVSEKLVMTIFDIMGKVSVEVISRIATKNVTCMKVLSDFIWTCGRFNYQVQLTELLCNFYWTCLAECKKDILIVLFAGNKLNVRLSKLFDKITAHEFPIDCRIFLNTYNESRSKCKIFSITAEAIFFNEMQIHKPMCNNNELKLWVDFNIMIPNITFYCGSKTFDADPSNQVTVMVTIPMKSILTFDTFTSIENVTIFKIIINLQDEGIKLNDSIPIPGIKNVTMNFKDSLRQNILEKCIIQEYKGMIKKSNDETIIAYETSEVASEEEPESTVCISDSEEENVTFPPTAIYKSLSEIDNLPDQTTDVISLSIKESNDKTTDVGTEIGTGSAVLQEDCEVFPPTIVSNLLIKIDNNLSEKTTDKTIVLESSLNIAKHNDMSELRMIEPEENVQINDKPDEKCIVSEIAPVLSSNFTNDLTQSSVSKKDESSQQLNLKKSTQVVQTTLLANATKTGMSRERSRSCDRNLFQKKRYSKSPLPTSSTQPFLKRKLFDRRSFEMFQFQTCEDTDTKSVIENAELEPVTPQINVGLENNKTSQASYMPAEANIITVPPVVENTTELNKETIINSQSFSNIDIESSGTSKSAANSSDETRSKASNPHLLIEPFQRPKLSLTSPKTPLHSQSFQNSNENIKEHYVPKFSGSNDDRVSFSYRKFTTSQKSDVGHVQSQKSNETTPPTNKKTSQQNSQANSSAYRFFKSRNKTYGTENASTLSQKYTRSSQKQETQIGTEKPQAVSTPKDVEESSTQNVTKREGNLQRTKIQTQSSVQNEYAQLQKSFAPNDKILLRTPQLTPNPIDLVHKANEFGSIKSQPQKSIVPNDKILLRTPQLTHNPIDLVHKANESGSIKSQPSTIPDYRKLPSSIDAIPIQENSVLLEEHMEYAQETQPKNPGEIIVIDEAVSPRQNRVLDSNNISVTLAEVIPRRLSVTNIKSRHSKSEADVIALDDHVSLSSADTASSSFYYRMQLSLYNKSFEESKNDGADNDAQMIEHVETEVLSAAEPLTVEGVEEEQTEIPILIQTLRAPVNNLSGATIKTSSSSMEVIGPTPDRLIESNESSNAAKSQTWYLEQWIETHMRSNYNDGDLDCDATPAVNDVGNRRNAKPSKRLIDEDNESGESQKPRKQLKVNHQSVQTSPAKNENITLFIEYVPAHQHSSIIRAESNLKQNVSEQAVEQYLTHTDDNEMLSPEVPRTSALDCNNLTSTLLPYNNDKSLYLADYRKDLYLMRDHYMGKSYANLVNLKSEKDSQIVKEIRLVREKLLQSIQHQNVFAKKVSELRQQMKAENKVTADVWQDGNILDLEMTQHQKDVEHFIIETRNELIELLSIAQSQCCEVNEELWDNYLQATCEDLQNFMNNLKN